MPQIFEIIGLVILGLIPSLVWLSFYFREDCHPEPKALIVRAFLMGIILSPTAIIFHYVFISIVSFFVASSINDISQSAPFYAWAAFSEEIVKFAAVWFVIIRRPEFDEPIDAMIYMIAAALGFAAMENILIAFKVIPSGATTTLTTLMLRFIGATLLHALSSAIVGYFLAVSWFYRYRMKKIIATGILAASLIHFIFNFIIASAATPASALLLTTLLLLSMALLVSIMFDKLKDHRTTALFANSEFNGLR